MNNKKTKNCLLYTQFINKNSIFLDFRIISLQNYFFSNFSSFLPEKFYIQIDQLGIFPLLFSEKTNAQKLASLICLSRNKQFNENAAPIFIQFMTFQI